MTKSVGSRKHAFVIVYLENYKFCLVSLLPLVLTGDKA